MNVGVYVLVILTAIVFHQCQALCPSGWIQGGLYCYFFSTEAVPKLEAEEACTVDYAHLAYIDDDPENIFLAENGPATTLLSYWIGYEQVFGTIWRWKATGTSGTYKKWDIGEPDGEGSCARITPYIQGVWRDWDCTKSLPFICKKFADCGAPLAMPDSTMVIEPDLGEIAADTDIAYPLSATATYTCITGSEFRDESVSKTSECSVGGVWKPDYIADGDICERKSCLPPELFEHDIHMQTNATELTKDFGTVVYYRCQDGYWFNQYELGVTKYKTCKSDKTWDGPSINECSKVYCVRPVTGNAYADTPLNSFGIIATYSCVPGYRYPDGEFVKQFLCTDVGWEPPPIQCEEMLCPEYSVMGATPSIETRAVFDTVVWKCDKGRRYSDTTTRKTMKCQLDETWDKPITDECLLKKCEGAPPNASLTYTHDYNETLTYRFQDTLTYACIPEWFFSDGNPTRTVRCNEYGLWSPSELTDCIGEKIEVVHGITHPPKESEGSTAMGTVALMIIGIGLGALVVLDAVTIGKHIAKLKSNVCPNQQEGDDEDEEVVIRPKSAEGTPLHLTDV